ncbi:hypothetical protein [Moorena producens]|uniref:hypothetical protein n=1 Tax=Moorena producens TaxID=1155739 RepID=UPI003C73DAB7
MIVISLIHCPPYDKFIPDAIFLSVGSGLNLFQVDSYQSYPLPTLQLIYSRFHVLVGGQWIKSISS